MGVTAYSGASRASFQPVLWKDGVAIYRSEITGKCKIVDNSMASAVDSLPFMYKKNFDNLELAKAHFETSYKHALWLRKKYKDSKKALDIFADVVCGECGVAGAFDNNGHCRSCHP